MEETATVAKKKSTGNKKIEIKKIQKKNNLQVTFSKRRRGLFKKAAELSVLCGADVAVLVQSPGGKLYAAGGRASVDSIIDRYLSGKASSSSSYDDVASQIHRQQEEEEEKKFLDTLKQIEIEKAKGKRLMQDKGDNSKEFWWEQPVDNLELDELVEYMAALEILRKNILTKAEEMAANNNAADNNAIAAADNDAGNNNVAANNNADFSSGVLIPNVSLDSFGGLPVIHCESDNEDKVDGTDDPLMVENLNFKTNSHQLLMSGNPKLETDNDEHFMFDNPNPLIDINQPIMLPIAKLEFDGDEPLTIESPKPPFNIDQLLMLENPQNNIDDPLMLENPDKCAAQVLENPNPLKANPHDAEPKWLYEPDGFF